MSRTRAFLWGLVTDSRGLLFSAGGGMGRRRAVEEVNYTARAGKVSVLVALLRPPSRAPRPRFESLRSELCTAFVPCSQWSTFSLFQWLTAIVSKPSPSLHHVPWQHRKPQERMEKYAMFVWKRTFGFRLLCMVGQMKGTVNLQRENPWSNMNLKGYFTQKCFTRPHVLPNLYDFFFLFFFLNVWWKMF